MRFPFGSSLAAQVGASMGVARYASRPRRLIDTSEVLGYNSQLLMKRSFPRAGLIVILAALVSPILLRPAYGYLDPGTGSYIIQLLVGGLLGGLFAIGLFWKRVVAFVKRLFKPRTGQ